MILSASRRTDIPAFYADWFRRRVQEGFFVSVNPFNPRQVKRVDITPERVEVVVFWTKDPWPLVNHLNWLQERGYDYCFQFTLNSYPKELEPRVPPLKTRVESFQRLADKLGPGRVVWRYDPIILSNVTPLSYHEEEFGRLAEALGGCAERVVVSFLDIYSRVAGRSSRLEKKGIYILDITEPRYREELRSLCDFLVKTSEAHDLEIYTCCEEMGPSEIGIRHGKCIDDELIYRLFGKKVGARKDKNQRGNCLCVESTDMGMYDTCQFGCLYCYATGSRKAVRNKIRHHNPDSPLLVGEPDDLVDRCPSQARMF